MPRAAAEPRRAAERDERPRPRPRRRPPGARSPAPGRRRRSQRGGAPRPRRTSRPWPRRPATARWKGGRARPPGRRDLARRRAAAHRLPACAAAQPHRRGPAACGPRRVDRRGRGGSGRGRRGSRRSAAAPPTHRPRPRSPGGADTGRPAWTARCGRRCRRPALRRRGGRLTRGHAPAPRRLGRQLRTSSSGCWREEPSPNPPAASGSPLAWAAHGSAAHALPGRDYVAVAEALTQAGNRIERELLADAHGPLYAWLEERSA